MRHHVGLLMLIALVPGVSESADIVQRESVTRPIVRWCEPMVPVLRQETPVADSDSAPPGCALIDSVAAWDAYCDEHRLDCDPVAADLFELWTLVAVEISTESPVVCENAGAVPAWTVDCLTIRPGMVQARVERTGAGSECLCSSGPQTPLRITVVNAIPRTGLRRCRAWSEQHVVGCFGR
jgi:hypothetical protein